MLTNQICDDVHQQIHNYNIKEMYAEGPKK